MLRTNETTPTQSLFFRHLPARIPAAARPLTRHLRLRKTAAACATAFALSVSVLVTSVTATATAQTTSATTTTALWSARVIETDQVVKLLPAPPSSVLRGTIPVAASTVSTVGLVTTLKPLSAKRRRETAVVNTNPPKVTIPIATDESATASANASPATTAGKPKAAAKKTENPTAEVADTTPAETSPKRPLTLVSTAQATDNVRVGSDIAESTWAALRQCESGGRYDINTGNGFYGAYQFVVGTWHALGYSGYPHEAAPAVQDEAARRLQAKAGWGQWPACSRKLGLR